VTARGALEVAVVAARLLENLGIRYVVVGSVASALHGEPRATLDVDLTLRLRSSDVQPLCSALAEEFFIDPAALRDSVRTGIACNAIHRATHVKLDLYVRANEGIHAAELRRAQRVRLTGEPGSEVDVASPEDIVLQKLLWFRKGGETSDRQWRDVLGVLKARGPGLDHAYLDQWAPELGVSDLLSRSMREAGLE
jgi:hypothetical protein